MAGEGDSQIEHQDVTSPPDLHQETDPVTEIESRGGAPYTIQFINDCFEKGAIRYDESEEAKEVYEHFGYQVRIDVDTMRTIAEAIKNSPSRSQEDENYLDKAVAQFPEDFDWDKETQRAVRDAINIIYQLKFVERDILVKASRLAGPGNVKIQAEGEQSELSLKRWKDFLRAQKRAGETAPSIIPDSKKSRDAHIDFFIGSDLLGNDVVDYLMNAKANNIPLSIIDAYRLGLVVNSAHEYGHAIEYALVDAGKALSEKQKDVGGPNIVDAIKGGLDSEIVRHEHFARGIENMVLKKALSDIFGYTPEQVRSFMGGIKRPEKDTDQSLEEMAAHAQKNKLNVDDVIQILDMTQGDGEVYSYDKIIKTVCYSSTPYSEEQIRTITQN